MTRIVESDNWGPGASILAEDALARIRSVLEESPIIVEHWFYRGASAPERIIFDDYELFLAYVHTESRAGDTFNVWRFDQLCRDANMLAHGKLPDELGRVPERGAY